MRRRRRTPRQIAAAAMPIEERVAHLICDTVHRGNCACAEGNKSTCGIMRFAAKRAIAEIQKRLAKGIESDGTTGANETD